jgi:hypothetical protein
VVSIKGNDNLGDKPGGMVQQDTDGISNYAGKYDGTIIELKPKNLSEEEKGRRNVTLFKGRSGNYYLISRYPGVFGNGRTEALALPFQIGKDISGLNMNEVVRAYGNRIDSILRKELKPSISREGTVRYEINSVSEKGEQIGNQLKKWWDSYIESEMSAKEAEPQAAVTPVPVKEAAHDTAVQASIPAEPIKEGAEAAAPSNAFTFGSTTEDNAESVADSMAAAIAAELEDSVLGDISNENDEKVTGDLGAVTTPINISELEEGTIVYNELGNEFIFRGIRPEGGIGGNGIRLERTSGAFAGDMLVAGPNAELFLTNPKPDVSPYRPSREVASESFSQEAEIEWFKKRFPGIPINLVENIANIVKDGDVDAWGVFHNSAVYIAKHAGKGTAQHEAFHAVYRLLLTDEQRADLFNEAKERFGVPENSKLEALMKAHPNLNDEQLISLYYEEELADAFAEYSQTQVAPKSLGQKIMKFLKDLWQTIKSLVRSTSTIDEVFYRMESGKYAKPSKTAALQRDVALAPVSPKRTPGISNIEELERARTMNAILYSKIDAARKDPKMKALAKADDIEIIKNLGKGDMGAGLISLYKKVYLSLHNDALQTKNPNLKKRLHHTLHNIINPETGKMGPLVIKALRELRTHGLNVNLKVDTGQFKDTLQVEKAFEHDEETTALEGWQIEHITVSSKEYGSQRLKRFMHNIPAKHRNGVPETDSLNYVKYINYDQIHNNLERDLSDSLSIDDMYNSLDNLKSVRNEYTYIKKKLQEDPQLRAEFFSVFSRSHADFITIRSSKKRVGRNEVLNTSVFSSNRRETKKLVGTLWSNSIEATTGTNVKTKGELDPKKVQAVIDNLDKLSKKLDLIANNATKDAVVKEARKLGLDINRDVIDGIAQEATKKVQGKEVTTPAHKNLQKFTQALTRVANIMKTGNPFERQNKKDLNTVIEAVTAASTELADSAFRNVENKTVYSHILGNFMTQTMAKLKGPDAESYIRRLLATDTFQGHPLLTRLLNENFRNQFGYSLLDGYHAAGSFKGKKYSQLSEVEREAVMLNMFIGNNPDAQNTLVSGIGRFAISVPSDAPVLPFIKLEKKSKKEVIEELYEEAKREERRILRVKKENAFRKQQKEEGVAITEQLPEIKNFHKRGEQFVLLPFFNKFGKSVASNPAEAKRLIAAELDQRAQAERERLITKLNIEEHISNKIKNAHAIADLVNSYTYNHILAQTQTLTLFAGDPAFYKNSLDLQKRYKQIWSPGTFLQPDAEYTNEKGETYKVTKEYKTFYLEDNEIESAHGADIYDSLVESGTLEEEAARIAALYGYVEKDAGWKVVKDDKGNEFITKPGLGRKYPLQLVNETDAQAYITLDRWKDVMISLGRWNHKYDNAFERLKNDTPTEEDLKLTIQPFKPFHYGYVEINNAMVPVQHKNSEFVLTPRLAKKSEKLSKLLDHMNTNNIASVNFVSAVKVGQYGATDIDNLNNGVIHTMDNKNYRLQQETPEHHTDTENLLGSQIKKLIFSDIFQEADYMFSLGMNGPEMFAHYQRVLTEDIRTAFEGADSRMQSKEDVSNMLVQLAIEQNLGEEIEDALKLVEREVMEDGELKTVKVFNIPLSNPTISRKAEELINSVYKNNVNKLKVNGGTFIQASAFGFSEDLEILTREDGSIEALEVYLPYWSKKYFPTNEEGDVDFDKIKEEAPELLDMIGYRIPTEDKYSMPPIRVKGFLPRGTGGVIMLPSDITTQTGSDFDVDKMFVMIHNFRVVNGKIEKVEYLTEENSTSEERLKVAMEEGTKELFLKLKRFAKSADNPDKLTADIEKAIELLETKNLLISEVEKQIQNYLEISPEVVGIKEELDEKYELRKTTKRNSAAYEALTLEIAELNSRILLTSKLREKQTVLNALKEGKIPAAIKLGTENIRSIIQGEDTDVDKQIKALITPIFEQLTVEEQNTRTARDNRKIDIYRSILTDKTTTESLMNPGGFDSLKELAKDLLELQGKPRNLEEEVDLLTPSGQFEIFNRNMTGAGLIGIFANHNSNHAITQFMPVLGYEEGIRFTGEDNNVITASNLTRTSTLDDGGKISRNLATFLAAVVDNAKEPLAGFFNLTMTTADSAALLTRLGFDPELTLMFLAQPVLKTFSEQHALAGGTLRQKDKVLSSLKQGIKGKLKSRYEAQGKELSTLEEDINRRLEKPLSLKELKSFIKHNAVEPDSKKRTTEYYLGQLAAIEQFNIVSKKAQHLGSFVTAIKADGTNSKSAPGPTISHTLAYLDKVQEVMNSDELIGAGSILGADSSYPSVKEYYNSIVKAKRTMDKYFLWGQPGMRELHSKAASIKGEPLSAEEMEFFNYNFMTFLASKFGSFQPVVKDSEVEGVNAYNAEELIIGKGDVEGLPKRFEDLLTDYPELENNPFLAMLSTIKADKDNPIDHLDFNNIARMRPEQRVLYARSLEDLIYTEPTRGEETDEEYTKKTEDFQQLGRDLVHYGFFTGGFMFRPGGFSNFIPVKFWENFNASKITITGKEEGSDTKEDLDITTFSEQLDSFMQEASSPTTAEMFASNMDNYLTQFYQNFPDKFNYLNKAITSGSNKNVTVYNTKGDNKGVYLDYTKTPSDLGRKDTVDGIDVYSFKEYVIRQVGEDTLLFKLENHENASRTGKAWWRPIPKLGIRNLHVEFYPNEAIGESMHKNRTAAGNAVDLKNQNSHTITILQGGEIPTVKTSTSAASELPAAENLQTENTSTSGRKTYKGLVEKVNKNQIFVFGSNMKGIHGAGAAGAASKMGLTKAGQARGIMTSKGGMSYALPTITVPGQLKSLPEEVIIDNIKELYQTAQVFSKNEFLIGYTEAAARPDGTNLSGWTPQEIANMFAAAGPIPNNIVFNEEFAKLVDQTAPTTAEANRPIQKKVEDTTDPDVGEAPKGTFTFGQKLDPPSEDNTEEHNC